MATSQVLSFTMLSLLTTLLQCVHGIYHPHHVEFYFHDTIFDKADSTRNTAVLVAAPDGKVDALRDGLRHFGAVVVFDDPLTQGPSITSAKIGYAQGMYVYTGRSNVSALWSFTAFVETSHYKGSLSFMGAEMILMTSRKLSVVGGTDDFEMARGMATLHTTKVVGGTHFTLHFNVTLTY